MNERELYPGWETVRKIGSGSFGAVYEIARTLPNGKTEKAALKVITIPQNEGDVEELYSSGYDDASITAHFKSYLADIVNEYSLMAEIKGHTNVVYCDDIRYIQHDDGFGWDIFIKMELLTSLMKAKASGAVEDTVKKLGADICSALVLCREKNIVHRDIKPQNIFVSEHGDYKLGDFGIAKTVEKTTGGTKIGTYGYMAPEVYNNQPYGAAADIYSLGLVMYWLLNEHRLPFLPMPPKVPTSTENEQARLRRFRGEPIPAPKTGSEALKRIVLKACAYDPNDRYHTADEMLADLKGLEGERQTDSEKELQKSETDDIYKTSSAREKAKLYNNTQGDEEKTVSVLAESAVRQPQAEKRCPVESKKPHIGKVYAAILGTVLLVLLVILQNKLHITRIPSPELKQGTTNTETSGTAVSSTVTQNTSNTEATKPSTAATTAVIPISIPFSTTIGSTVEFGHYEQNGNSADGPEPIEWYVISKDENTNALLLLSMYGLDNVQYHKENKDITWAKCDLREWLNSESGFWGTAFSSEEKERVETTLCKTPSMNFPGCQTVGGDDTVDKIFLLSLDEFGDNGIGDNDEWRNVSPTPYALSQGAWRDEWGHYLWWLRTPGGEQNVVCDGYTGGARSSSIVNTSQLLRPALWVVADDADPAQETTQEIKPTSWVEGNWTWSLENGVLTISGKGNMGNFGLYDSPWYSQRATITRVVVEEGITGIGVYAFFDCRNVSSVSFPHSLRYIRECAFYFNDRLKTVEIPEGVTYIGGSAFHQCEALESISIPSSLAALDDNPFIYCYALTQIRISQDNSCFKVVDGALFSKDTKTLFCYLPGNGGSSYIIPDGVVRIGMSAFCGCEELTSVIIPEGVTSIGSNAFVYCSGLTSASIPQSVNLIEGAAFFCCDNLTEIYYAGSESQWNKLIGNGQADIPNGCTIHYNHKVR